MTKSLREEIQGYIKYHTDEIVQHTKQLRMYKLALLAFDQGEENITEHERVEEEYAYSLGEQDE